MKPFNFISVRLSVCLILGILIGFYFELPPIFTSVALAVLALFLTIAFLKSSRKNSTFFGVSTHLTTIALGAFVVSLANSKNFPYHYSHQNLGKSVVWKIKIDEVLKPSSISHNYIAHAIAMDSTQVTGKLLLNIRKDTTITKEFSVDDELLVFSKAEVLAPLLNPHQFDYKAYLEKLGVFHRLQIHSSSYFKLENPTKTVFGIAANFREELISKLKKAPFGKEELGVMEALLLGQRKDISESTYSNYKDAGAVHILAVSGLHIGILLFILEFLFKPLESRPKGKTIKLLVILVLLWSYAFIAGLSPSIFRAVMMFSFVAYALYLNRPTSTFNILALSMFFILLIKPMVLFQVGFQMSYAAVFSIIWIYPKLQRFWYPSNWLVKKGWQLLSVSCAAQLGVLPISLFYFHQFPSLFFISNLIDVPFLGIILGLGILVLALASLDLLSDVIAIGYNFLITSMNTVIAFVAEQEGFVLRDISFDLVQLVLAYILIIFFVGMLAKPNFKKAGLFLVSTLVFQGWLIYNEWQLGHREKLILGNQTANTFLLHQKGKHLNVINSEKENLERIVNAYKIAERIESTTYESIQNNYQINNKKIHRMDSLGILPQRSKLSYLLLTQSPKINLERVLDSVSPEMILIDGSNYKSYVQRWKQTCLKSAIPFHYTGEKGAFYFELE